MYPPLRVGHTSPRATLGWGRWSDGTNWPIGPAWVNERLARTHTVPPIDPDGRGASLQDWAEWWTQTRMIPPEAWYQLGRIPLPTYLTSRLPITDLTHLQQLRKIKVGEYPDGSNFTYDDLPGLAATGLAFRLDWLHLSGSVAVIPHEAAHLLNLFVWGRPDQSDEWLEIHRTSRHPDSYTAKWPVEFLCESAAFKASGMIHLLDPSVQDFMARLWKAQGYTAWPAGY